MNDSPAKVPVMVRLTRESVDRLDKAAGDDGRTRSGMARFLIERSLDQHERGAK